MFLSNFENRNAFSGLTPLTGLKIKLMPVQRAHHLPVANHPFRQGTPSMGTMILDGKNCSAAGTEDRDFPSVNDKTPALPHRDLINRA